MSDFDRCGRCRCQRREHGPGLLCPEFVEVPADHAQAAFRAGMRYALEGLDVGGERMDEWDAQLGLNHPMTTRAEGGRRFMSVLGERFYFDPAGPNDGYFRAYPEDRAT